jgi:transcriptional regulator with PAS, ATPase and Fis domain
VRILAASNRQPRRAIREGRPREDLYFRLSVLSIELPPLRERIENVPLLVEEFLRQFNREHRKAVQGINEDCLSSLEAYLWPGNVRELRNVIERPVILCRSSMLSSADLPIDLADQARVGTDLDFTIRLGSSLKEVEAELIFRTLSAATVHRVLLRLDLNRLPSSLRRNHRRRYSRPIPDERVQMDVCRIGPICYQYTAVDDRSTNSGRVPSLRVLAVSPLSNASSPSSGRTREFCDPSSL